MNNLQPIQTLSFHSNPYVNEKTIEQTIIKDPSILGLGDLEIAFNQKEIAGGIIDIIADSRTSNVRYIVELQLGELDPSHIIRLIEYWNNERRENPDKKCRAVLIAEKTTRYLDVLYLLQEVVPITVLQMVGIKQEDKTGVLFTKVLSYNKEKDASYKRDVEPKTAEYWESESSKTSIASLNAVFGLIQEIKAQKNWKEEISPNYTKFYVGMKVDGISKKFIYFRTTKNILKMCIDEIVLTEEIINKINESSDISLQNDATDNSFLTIKESAFKNTQSVDILKEVITRSYEMVM